MEMMRTRAVVHPGRVRWSLDDETGVLTNATTLGPIMTAPPKVPLPPLPTYPHYELTSLESNMPDGLESAVGPLMQPIETKIKPSGMY